MTVLRFAPETTRTVVSWLIKEPTKSDKLYVVASCRLSDRAVLVKALT